MERVKTAAKQTPWTLNAGERDLPALVPCLPSKHINTVSKGRVSSVCRRMRGVVGEGTFLQCARLYMSLHADRVDSVPFMHS